MNSRTSLTRAANSGILNILVEYFLYSIKIFSIFNLDGQMSSASVTSVKAGHQNILGYSVRIFSSFNMDCQISPASAADAGC